ncbi:hypothetical protein [Vibrio spartinae]|uniref:Uncharacterized protein n=1 Tax=Vibrio spartinae TaxID=1918945 RepID=A0A1N6M6C9_9VIBR|nr:hypothetical protein [Vibrio spartinae]QMV14728.1 hypothetical protein Vspart_01997 [Vibrio spartinae]SIO94992.1 hypothetical protein VSP9026_02729 [Vibrio spartinae]
MVTQKSKPAEHLEYEVLVPYQCPNQRCWYQKGDVVDLLPCEAEFLKLGGKVKAVLTTQQKEKANA